MHCELDPDEGRLREESGETPKSHDVSALYDLGLLFSQAAAVGAAAAFCARESGWKGDWQVLMQALVNGGRFPHKSGVHRRHGTA